MWRLFLALVWLSDPFGDPISIATAWEVAQILEGRES